MRHFLMLVFATLGCIVGSFTLTPFVGVAGYYFLSVFRPNYLWKWQLWGLPWIGWSFYVATAAILAYAVWAVGALTYGRREDLLRFRPKPTAAHWLTFAFAGWVTLSYLFSNNMDHSELWFGEYLKIFGMFFLASRVVCTARQVEAVFLLVTVALGYIAVEMNMLYFMTGKPVIYHNGFAGFDNNGAALMLAMGVPLCYFAWEFTGNRWLRWAYLAAIPVFVHAILMSYSRGAFLAMLAPAPLYLIFSRRRAFLLAGMGVMLGLTGVMAGKEVQERLTSIGDAKNDDSFNSRLTSWRIAVEIANDYPLFGAGVRCSNLETYSRGADMQGRAIHNQYLQIAADSGWPALALYLGTFLATGYCILRALRALWPRADDAARRGVSVLAGLTCALATFCVGAFALSLEVFELPYIITLLAAQVWGLMNAADGWLPGGYRPAAAPPPAGEEPVVLGPVRLAGPPEPAGQPVGAGGRADGWPQ